MNGPKDNCACSGYDCRNTFFVDNIQTHPWLPPVEKGGRKQIFCSDECRNAKLAVFKTQRVSQTASGTEARQGELTFTLGKESEYLPYA